MKKLLFILLMMGLGASLYANNITIMGNNSSCQFVDVVKVSTGAITHFGPPYPTLPQSTTIVPGDTINLTLVTGQTVQLILPLAGSITSTYTMGTIMCTPGSSYQIVVTIFSTTLGGDITIDIQ